MISDRIRRSGKWLVLATALAGAAGAAVSVRAASNEELLRELDITKILRCQATDSAGIAACDEARELTIFHCTVCHTFVPIVMMQNDRGAWHSILTRHKASFATELTPDEMVKLEDYFVANFNPSLPPPELPQQLLDTWTAY